MGCTSSKSLEMQARRDGWNPPISRSFVRSLSMPLRQRQKSLPQPHRREEFHTVALTSSTYGALRIPDEDDDGFRYSSIEQEEKEEAAAPLAAGTKDLEQRIQASPALVDLSKPAALPSVPEAEVIDLWELMKDLTDDIDNVEDSSTTGSRHKSMVRKRRETRSRVLSRSISSVDSMRELDVKIRSVALALPNFEKKLRALDALNSISRGVADEEEQVFFRYRKSREDFQSSSVKSSPARAILHNMKGLFYGATLEELRAQSTSISTMASSSSSSSCSYDASSSCGESEESSSLFDPEVLKTFQQPEDQGQAEQMEQMEQQLHSIKKVAAAAVSKKMMSSKVLAIDQVEEKTLLDGLAAVCPPRGERRAVLYVTSLRGIRKTFEDCHRVRMILQGFGVAIDERDVSMHTEFRQELKELLAEVAERKSRSSNASDAAKSSAPPMPVPRLFIGGRYVGGVEEVSQMNEDGLIGRLVEGLPRQSSVAACEGCGGVRFVPCLECSGSCKVVVFGGGVGDFSGSGVVVRCSYCNENGLIRCPVCL